MCRPTGTPENAWLRGLLSFLPQERVLWCFVLSFGVCSCVLVFGFGVSVQGHQETVGAPRLSLRPTTKSCEAAAKHLHLENARLQPELAHASCFFKSHQSKKNTSYCAFRSFAKGLTFSGFTGKSLLNQRG